MDKRLYALELLVLRAKECREAQRYYFKHKMPENLRQAKIKEQKLDDLITLFIKRGVNPENAKEKVVQSKMY